MRLHRHIVITIVLALVGLGTAPAFSGNEPTLQDLEKLLITPPPAKEKTATALEHTAATAPLDGSQYAVIAPIFLGANNGPTSFIRLANVDDNTATFQVNVVNATTGQVLGTAPIQILKYSSVQFPITQILPLAGITGTPQGEIALYVQGSTGRGVFNSKQSIAHVVFNLTTLFFENATSCQYPVVPAENDSALVFNAHTTLISSYPSTIFLHNYANVATSYDVTVVDALSGTIKGTVPVVINANTTTSVTVQSLQQAVGWTPSGQQGHVNLGISPTATGIASPPVMVTPFVYSLGQSSYVNMAPLCRVPGPLSAPTTKQACRTTAGPEEGYVAGAYVANTTACGVDSYPQMMTEITTEGVPTGTIISMCVGQKVPKGWRPYDYSATNPSAYLCPTVNAGVSVSNQMLPTGIKIIKE